MQDAVLCSVYSKCVCGACIFVKLVDTMMAWTLLRSVTLEATMAALDVDVHRLQSLISADEDEQEWFQNEKN